MQEYIRLGSFDRLLLRPASPLVQVIADQFSLRRLGKVAEGLVVLVAAAVVVDIDWTVVRALLVVVTVISGAAIFSALWIFTSCLCFWWVDAREAQNAVTYGGGFLAQYPIGIYGSWLRRMLAYAVPIAFVNYFPAVYVLGRDDRLGAAGVDAVRQPARRHCDHRRRRHDVAVRCAALPEHGKLTCR